ncbi:lateral organ boundaries-domain 16 [Actinidia rufa]|uniref:Lateral organ boundaries-domain 16 n=1 Tax=Actinidia rufa TaxID=165716 RepID=A0A7J0FLL3_9ERIC|nr:lateral organ boundaries-domain 16 [Actinidia rufa]
MAAGAGSPCGACKFLRRKCSADCVFAPYFCSEQGPARFAAIHKVFGASNVSKLLLHMPVPDRCEAVVTITYEAQARMRDPVYGCVAHIFALQQQVACLQAQLMQVKAQLAQNLNDARQVENQIWPGNTVAMPKFSNLCQSNLHELELYLSSELARIDRSRQCRWIERARERERREEFCFQTCTKKRPSQTDFGELQALALRMMRN